MTQFNEFLQVVLSDPVARRAYEDSQHRNEIVDKLVARRKELKLSKQTVAKRMGHSARSTVRRFEAEGSNPNLGTIQQYARAVGLRVNLRLEPWEPIEGYPDQKTSEEGVHVQ